MTNNRLLLITKIANEDKSQGCVATVIDTPKDLADHHKEFNAVVVEQTLTSCKAVVGDLTLSYGPEANAEW